MTEELLAEHVNDILGTEVEEDEIKITYQKIRELDKLYQQDKKRKTYPNEGGSHLALYDAKGRMVNISSFDYEPVPGLRNFRIMLGSNDILELDYFYTPIYSEAEITLDKCTITSGSSSIFSFPNEPEDNRLTTTNSYGYRRIIYDRGSPISKQGLAELRNRLDYFIPLFEDKS